MALYLLRRVLVSVPTLIGITLVTFLVSHLLPADLVLVNLGDRATRNPELVRAFRARWSLDRPLPVQYLVYLRNLARGNLGASIATNRPVLTELALSLPMTIELATLSTLIALVVGVGFGVVAAVRRDTLVDTAARAVSLVGVAVPTFWFAILLLSLVYFRLGWAPPPGRLTAGVAPPDSITGMYLVDSALRGQWTVFRDALAHLVLPVVVLATIGIGYVTRITRASMLEVLHQDYVRTARAKGVAPLAVVIRHALRNALIPIITVGGTLYAQLMSGTVMTETIFSLPGLGRYSFSSAASLDFPAVMGVALIVGVLYIGINLTVDVLYVWVNPRIRYD
ncbi:MAG TPA: ABC transporter permease [bacterium]|nr:ABC transporter permease [bacterium]